MLAIAVALGSLTAAPAVGAGGKLAVRISPRTGPIYLYDGSVLGTGPELPATSVTATARNCPPWFYFRLAGLVQDGVQASWATTAHGAGEVVCNGQTRVEVGMAFYSPTLHPGTATVTFGISSQSTVRCW